MTDHRTSLRNVRRLAASAVLAVLLTAGPAAHAEVKVFHDPGWGKQREDLQERYIALQRESRRSGEALAKARQKFTNLVNIEALGKEFAEPKPPGPDAPLWERTEVDVSRKAQLAQTEQRWAEWQAARASYVAAAEALFAREERQARWYKDQASQVDALWQQFQTLLAAQPKAVILVGGSSAGCALSIVAANHLDTPVQDFHFTAVKVANGDGRTISDRAADAGLPSLAPGAFDTYLQRFEGPSAAACGFARTAQLSKPVYQVNGAPCAPCVPPRPPSPELAAFLAQLRGPEEAAKQIALDLR